MNTPYAKKFILLVAAIVIFSGCASYRVLSPAEEAEQAVEQQSVEPVATEQPVANDTMQNLNNENVEEEQAETTPTDIDTTNWQTYVNEEYEFSFDYPNNLFLEKDEQQITVFYGTPETYSIAWIGPADRQSSLPLMNISVSAIDQDTLVSEYKKYDSEYGKNLSEGDIQMGEVSGYYVEKRNSVGLTAKTYFVEANGRNIIIHIPSVPDYDQASIIGSYRQISSQSR